MSEGFRVKHSLGIRVVRAEKGTAMFEVELRMNGKVRQTFPVQTVRQGDSVCLENLVEHTVPQEVVDAIILDKFDKP